MKNLVLKTVPQQNRYSFMELLLLADESEEVVNDYIDEGEMFSIQYEENLAGVILFIFHPGQIVEVKNMVVIEDFRGKGLGKTVLNMAFEVYRDRGLVKMIVGTANSSIANLAFYQKAGFRMTEIKRGFFEKYPTPIYENGIRALDMVMFERILT
jgi:ribosomal protein S18 acetylase RimI-like enzyme